MSGHWSYSLKVSDGLIVLIGKSSYWEKPLTYEGIIQTLSQCDHNSGSTTSSRKLARRFLELPDVSKVKLTENTINLSVSKTTSLERAKEIAEQAMDIVQDFDAYE